MVLLKEAPGSRKRKINHQMERIIFSFFLLLIFNGSYSQQKVDQAFLQFYQKHLKLFHKNTYICDSLVTGIDLRPSETENLVGKSENSRVQKILKKGKRLQIGPDDIVKYLPEKIKLVSRKQFSEIKSEEVYFTSCEDSILSDLDSLDKIKTTIEFSSSDSSIFQKVKKSEDKLFDSPCFKSYREKLRVSKKQLITFFPVYYYKNSYLILWQNFHTVGERSAYGVIIKP